MNTIAYQLKQIDGLLSGLNIDYALIGGIAVSLYSEPRLTFDIDVEIILDNSKITFFIRKARRYGFYPLPKNIRSFAKKTGVLPMRFYKNNVEGKCDFIIAQNALEYSAIKRARSKKIYSINIKIVSPEDLLIHKLASDRPRDLEDAQRILTRQRKDLDLRYINLWVRKIAKLNKKPELVSHFKSILKMS